MTLAYFGYNMRPQTSAADDFNYRGFGEIQVIAEGRMKPLDTVARTSLMVITHRQSYYDYDTAETLPATKWLLDVQTTPVPSDDEMKELFPNGDAKRTAWKHKVFRIENDQLSAFLNLKPREGYAIPSWNSSRVGNLQAFFAEVNRVKEWTRSSIRSLTPRLTNWPSTFSCISSSRIRARLSSRTRTATISGNLSARR